MNIDNTRLDLIESIGKLLLYIPMIATIIFLAYLLIAGRNIGIAYTGNVNNIPVGPIIIGASIISGFIIMIYVSIKRYYQYRDYE